MDRNLTTAQDSFINNESDLEQSRFRWRMGLGDEEGFDSL